MILEACVETYEEAVKAQSRGANRIELCSRLDLDGLTPSPELIRKVCAELDIPVMVMIRPRGGNFVYSTDEVKTMMAEIERAKILGATGIVFGLLTEDNRVDVENCRHLTAAAYPLPVTFHKAIDELEDPVSGLIDLLQVQGITRILTSGGPVTAVMGVEKIREMIHIAGDRIIILVAGKVTDQNVAGIAELTNATEFHGRLIVGNLT